VRQFDTARSAALSQLGGVELPLAWHDLSAQDHCWLYWRCAVVRRLFAALELEIKALARAADIGCGVGLLREQEQIEGLMAWNVDGVGLNRDSLTRARPGAGPLFRCNISDQRRQFLEAYDYLFPFDVLEQIESTGPFVDSLLWNLRPGVMPFANVLALEVLQAEHDTAGAHTRRYNICTPGWEFAGRLVQTREARYWGFSAIPLVAMRRMLADRSNDAAQIMRGLGSAQAMD
jgi:hypothetical protein